MLKTGYFVPQIHLDLPGYLELKMLLLALYQWMVALHQKLWEKTPVVLCVSLHVCFLCYFNHFAVLLLFLLCHCLLSFPNSCALYFLHLSFHSSKLNLLLTRRAAIFATDETKETNCCRLGFPCFAVVAIIASVLSEEGTVNVSAGLVMEENAMGVTLPPLE
eukprot:Gb_03429 [translate_table: standard]